MSRKMPAESDRFYFYSSAFDPVYLIEKNALKDLTASPGYFKNAFGVLIKPEFLPDVLKDKAGSVEDVPIPANWHADIAEFGAAIRAVELSGDSFTMIELGCGWGCWMNITGVIAKKQGKQVHLYGIEGDKGHVQLANDTLTVNGLTPTEYKVYYGIATAKPGVALFPIQDRPGSSWAETPLFNVRRADAERLIKSGKYTKLAQIPLNEVGEKLGRIDLLHVDIQGGELELIPQAIDYITKTVAYLLIGTHSRQIEGALLDVLTKAGWILEIERPAILSIGDQVNVPVDGVQGWRNPKLLPDKAVCKVNTQGRIEVLDLPSVVKVNSHIMIPARIHNDSTTYWGEGRYPVRISYHWLDEGGTILVFDGERTPLGHNGNGIAPGESLAIDVHVKTPPKAGKYKIQLTLVQEGMMWFEKTGFTPSTFDIEAEP